MNERVSFGTDKAEQYRRTRATPSLLGGIWETDTGQQTFTDGQGNKTWLSDTTGGNVAIALPAAADVSPDTLFTVKRTTGGANTLVVTPNSGNIDGSAAHSVALQYAAFSYASDGSNYHIVRYYNPSEFVTSNSLSSAVATDSLVVRGSAAVSATASVGFVAVTGGQIRFPAAQNASADVNTLDDYEEGTWTPAVTFATPGDLSVAYLVQTGTYTKVGRNVVANCFLQTTTFTHTTASGNLRVSLPSALAGASQSSAAVQIQGYTKANYTAVTVETVVGQTYVDFVASGSGQSVSNLSTADMPTGGTVRLFFTLTYEI